MSLRATESPLRTFRQLWKRAPLWRLSGLLTALLTVWCLLFPARVSLPVPATAAVAQATYTPQPRPMVAPPSPVAEPAPLPAQATTTPTPEKAAPVQTAKLSLATPDNHATTADGLDNALSGRHLSGSLRVDGFDVPLPPGDWLELANMHFKQSTSAGELLMLGRVKNRRLMGYVRITAGRSTSDPAAGFRASPGCDRQNENTNVFVSEALEPFGHQACWLMDHSFLAPLQAWADRANKLPPLERAAAGDLAAKGVSYPQEMISLRFTRAETWGLLEVRYVFNPEEDHITSNNVATYADSDWQPRTISRYPEKVAYVDKLRHWGDDFWPRFKAAFDAAGTAPSR